MDSPFLGMVQYFAFDWTPRGYMNCNGALLSIATNTALFSLLGTTYGGDGRVTFALPDLRGRSVVNQGSSFSMGEVFGTTSATMLTTNMPSHTHTATGNVAGNSGTGGVADPTGAYPSGATAGRGVTATVYAASPVAGQFLGSGSPQLTVNLAGSNAPFSVLNPYLAVTATICNQGIFPSRN